MCVHTCVVCGVARHHSNNLNRLPGQGFASAQNYLPIYKYFALGTDEGLVRKTQQGH